MAPHATHARHLLAVNRLDEAEQSARRAIAAEPDDPAPRVLLARILNAGSRFDEAADTIGLALALEMSATALQVGSIAHRCLGDFDRSRQMIDEAIRIQPQSADLHIGRSLTLSAPWLDRRTEQDEAGRSDLGAAEESARHACHLDPDHPGAHYALALCRQALGDLPAAATALRDALDRRPDWGDAHRQLGYVRVRQGMPKLASRHFAAAGRLDPGDDASLNALRLLDRGRAPRRHRWFRRPTPNPFLVPEAQRIMAADLRMNGWSPE